MGNNTRATATQGVDPARQIAVFGLLTEQHSDAARLALRDPEGNA
jgi:hypothetical protein